MELITEQQIIDNGLNWVRTKDRFITKGSHYHPFYNVLDILLDEQEYRAHTVYYGDGNGNGHAETTFTRVSEQDKKEIEEKKKAIKEFEKKYNVRTDYVDKPFITTEQK